MLDEELIKKSKENIPNVSENLKESILEEYNNKPIVKKKRINLKLAIPTLSIFLVLIVSLSLIIGLGSKKDNSDIKDLGNGVYEHKGEETSDESFFSSFSKKATRKEGTGFSGLESFSDSGIFDTVPGGTTEESQYQIRAGKLTASELDDNIRYNEFKKLIESGQEENGEFYEFTKTYSFNTSNRVKIIIDKGLSATATIYNEKGKLEFTGISDRSGTIYLFPKTRQSGYKIKITNGKKTYEFNDVKDELDLRGQLTDFTDNHKNVIELMFVIDATGSMGDEMSYLKAEIENVIDRVKEANEGVTIYLSIMVYRDLSDEYITRYSDFRTDIDFQKDFLSKQYANGGGDFEEAVDIAFSEAVEKQWTNADSTKILVFVADAPAHDDDIKDLDKAIRKMAEKGIRIITVASSGIDKKTEYYFRTQSILTGGKYTFLTNHSGIGNEHIDPSTEEEYVVEHLNSMLIRLINGYHKGEFESPVPYFEDQSSASTLNK